MQEVKITNTSAVTQTMSSVTITGDFAKLGSSTCPTSLAPDASCVVDVTFTPTAQGTRNGTISITGSTNATINLTGIGGSITYSNLEQLTGWSVFADTGAVGTLTQGVANPSTDGASSRFQISGTTPYANVRWEDPVTNNSALAHYTMDAYVYIDDPSVAQAFRLGFYQAVSNTYYPFQLLCDLQSGAVWKVWDGANQTWVSTSASCVATTDIPARSWIHISLDFERSGANQMHYQTITVNGKSTSINVTLNPSTRSPDTLIAVFGENGNSNQSTYSVWVDRWNVTAW
jgi:hypothetical protein